jgi:hypothetical protein
VYWIYLQKNAESLENLDGQNYQNLKENIKNDAAIMENLAENDAAIMENLAKNLAVIPANRAENDAVIMENLVNGVVFAAKAK